MNATERAQLIDDLIDGDLTEADFLRLEAELSVDPKARQEYYDRLKLSVALEAEGEAYLDRPSNVISNGRPWWNTRTLATLAGGLAAAAALVVAFVWLSHEPKDILKNAVNEEQHVSGYAVLTGQLDAKWGKGGALSNGAIVPAGELELHEGVVQMELFSGVMVVLEAPAIFEVVSSMEMNLANGRVRAHVPEPAQGFRIRTAEGDVVDLGTEFALDISDGNSEVHVLEGDVEWHPREATVVRRLTVGEAIRASSTTGAIADLNANATAFIGPIELRQRLTSSRSNRHQEWQRQSEQLREDPRLIAYYHTGTSSGWNRRLPNLANTNLAKEGAIVAAARTRDRWGTAEGALDFSPAGSRVRVTVPGDYRSLTFICWVRIHSLDRWYNSLFLTDGHELSEPHWQIMDDGRLFFSVKKRDQWDSKKGERDKHIYYSPSFWDASLSGQWLMIATTYDVDARMVMHYLNGKRLSEEVIPEEYLVENVHIGTASLANWGLPERDDPHFAVRNLNGSMDEFMLFNAALPAEEIQTLYEHGTP